ncbi:hypothetical protein Hamer_G001411 [Homarus americanus]|uniref:Uncharacterized protein n=1 Tax=Homarus americanus TaxID=6706 RepID=A0A8J5THI5_HOMAM|nr:hypothetical protein Hamer_G001411 [Homarus americanus]
MCYGAQHIQSDSKFLGLDVGLWTWGAGETREKFTGENYGSVLKKNFAHGANHCIASSHPITLVQNRSPIHMKNVVMDWIIQHLEVEVLD